MKIRQTQVVMTLSQLVVALVIGLVVWFMVSSATVFSLLVDSVTYAIFALGVGLLLRQNGLVSFGHALFFGSSGYLVGWLLTHSDLSAELAIVVTLLIIAGVAFLLGLIFSRVPGISFAMLTLAVGQMAYLYVATARSFLGGADGMSIEWPSTLFGAPVSVFFTPSSMFLISWSLLVIVITVMTLLLKGRFGSVTEAVRDNEERARFIGIDMLLPRATVYTLSAMVTALGGLLSALYTGFISPVSLHWSMSGAALVMVILGGYKHLWGPVFGAVIYFFVREYVGEVTEYWMWVLGVLLIVIVVFLPNGVVGGLGSLVEAKGKRGLALQSKRGA